MNIGQPKNTNITVTSGYNKKKNIPMDKNALNSNISNIYNKETPLQRTSMNLSFKGVSDIGMRESKKYVVDPAKKLIKKTTEKAIDTLYKHVTTNEQLKQRIITENGTIAFKEKRPHRLLWDGIKYPFTKLPLHIADSTVKFLERSKIIKKTDWNSKTGFYARHRNALDNEDILNSLNGYMQSAEKYKNDPERLKSASIFQDAMKMFDSQRGNYNGVNERALTRVVTGFIPAFFLANDAYNLSRFCDDDLKAAKKEKKMRFNQETKRVLSNAYLQLITLGALAKYINSSKLWFVANTVVTVMFTEAYSRISNGKKIHFISKDEAQKINAKEKNKKNKGKIISDNKLPEPQKEKTTSLMSKFVPNATVITKHEPKPTFKGTISFKDFALAQNLTYSTNIPAKNVTSNKIKKGRNDKELKPILSLNTILKWIGATIVLGYAIKGAKTIKVGKDKKIGDYFKKAKDFCNEKIYKKLTEEKHTMSRDDLHNVTNKLSAYDEKLGSKYVSIVHDYQKASAIKDFAGRYAKLLEDAGLKEYAEEFTFLSKEKMPNVMSEARKIKLYKDNMKHFETVMNNNGQKKLFDEIKTILIDKKGTFNPDKYTDAYKKLAGDKSAKPFIRNLDNVFKIDTVEENIKYFEESISKLAENGQYKEEISKFKKAIENSTNATTYDLGVKNKFIVKEAVDFVCQPFKFIWNVITLPYKIANMITKAIKPELKPPQWPDEIKIISNSINRLKQRSKLDTESYRKTMDKSINKGFNTITMSSLSNSELSALSKNAATAATMTFLIADNYNMVMLKSNGEDKEGASTKAKERAVQETSRLFYQQLFINLFNNTFKSTYNSNLLGAQAVNTASTTISEAFTRKAIGMPIKESTRDDIIKQETDNLTNEGPKGKFFRFMSRLTGKKVLSQRETTKKADNNGDIKK